MFIKLSEKLIISDKWKKCSTQARCVYLALRSFSDGNFKEIFPSMEKISEVSGLGRQTVIRSIKSLKSHNLIVSKRRRRESCIYSFDYEKSLFNSIINNSSKISEVPKTRSIENHPVTREGLKEPNQTNLVESIKNDTLTWFGAMGLGVEEIEKIKKDIQWAMIVKNEYEYKQEKGYKFSNIKNWLWKAFSTKFVAAKYDWGRATAEVSEMIKKENRSKEKEIRQKKIKEKLMAFSGQIGASTFQSVKKAVIDSFPPSVQKEFELRKDYTPVWMDMIQIYNEFMNSGKINIPKPFTSIESGISEKFKEKLK